MLFDLSLHLSFSSEMVNYPYGEHIQMDNYQPFHLLFFKVYNKAFPVLISGVNDKEVKIQNIHEIIDYMKTDKNWMKSIKEKANARGISIDSMLMLDAIWVMKYQADERK